MSLRRYMEIVENAQVPKSFTFYHRSSAGPRSLTAGFREPNSGDYGAGVYGVLNWRFIEKTVSYGYNIIRCEVPNSRFLCLDTELDSTPIMDQLSSMGVEMHEFRCHGFTVDQVQEMLYANNYAHNFAQAFVQNGVFDQINGMVFNHVDWGPMIVVRARNLITVTGWVYEDDIKRDVAKTPFQPVTGIII